MLASAFTLVDTFSLLALTLATPLVCDASLMAWSFSNWLPTVPFRNTMLSLVVTLIAVPFGRIGQQLRLDLGADPGIRHDFAGGIGGNLDVGFQLTEQARCLDAVVDFYGSIS